ncbi:DUF6519 domain-containing protein [Bradyrhizobium tropiciagri]|uniref:DUF6519 domain-containing protein n=1 Tax=Bradyrhizobium tropiciagri TaxID=312253 RepID=UPI00067DB6ED|nr:DUF6519 domain-containing protein [Bradyrhizobium tropiciagri]
MSSDRSRRIETPHFGYNGVVAQQGRVVLDRDFNAEQALMADRVGLDALSFVGPCGTPDDGFRIDAPPPASPPSSPLSSPPSAAAADFRISPGLMYVGGQAVTLSLVENATTAPYSYLHQPDWPAPPPVVQPQRELVYLDVIELEVGAVEDPDLLEVALGGPDTTGRKKLLRRIKRVPVKQADCRAAWAEAVARWRQQGLAFNPLLMTLVPAVGLKVGFVSGGGTGDPCDPVVTGGYLGAENQLIRVRIDKSGGTPRLLWSYDNASFLYRVDTVNADKTRIKLTSDPPDAFHYPQAGQFVEVLATAALLGKEPDATGSPSGVEIVQAAAEPTGFIAALARAYGPAVNGDPTNYLVLNAGDWPSNFADNNLPVFVRVWQSAEALPASGGTVTIASAATGVSTGLTATITLPEKGVLPDGAFWEIAARPGTPQGVYPETLLLAPRPPDGPNRWVCPLAVIDWSAKDGPVITDCRQTFLSLVALSRRLPGCSTFSIGVRDLTTAKLQAWIDAAAATAPLGAVICLAAGEYDLDAPLRLDARHSGLTIDACGGPAVIKAAEGADPKLFVDGLVVLTSAADVTMRGLELYPVEAPASESLLRAFVNQLAVASLDAKTALRQPRVAFGFRLLNSARLKLQHCIISFLAQRPDDTADLIAAGTFAQGACHGLAIEECKFLSHVAPTYTRLELDTPSTPARLKPFLDDLIQVSLPSHSPLNLSVFNTAIAHTTVARDLTAAPPRAAAAAVIASPPAAAPAVPPASPPASPPSSPPAEVTGAELRDEKIFTGLAAVAANRLSIGAPAPKPAISTVGVLAANNGSARANIADLNCALEDAVVSDCEFDCLTLATWFSASFDVLRLVDNRCDQGVAGIWLELPGAAAPTNPAPNLPPSYPHTTYFEEYYLQYAFASAMPPPKDTSPPKDASKDTSKIDSAATNDAPREVTQFALHVRGNDVRTRVSTKDAQVSTSCLFLALNRTATGSLATVPENSVVVDGNRLVCGAGQFAPCALITFPQSRPCVISGNLMDNTARQVPDFRGQSLWLSVANAARGIDGVAVTGNTLAGAPSTLAQLTRLGVAAPANTWVIFNADPA